MKSTILLASAFAILTLSVNADAEFLTEEDFSHLDTPESYCEYLGEFARTVAQDRDKGISEGDSRGYVARWIQYEDMVSILLSVTTTVYMYPRLEPLEEGINVYNSCTAILTD